MGWAEIAGLVLQILWFLLQKWGTWSDEQKVTATNIFKEGTDAVKAKDISGITMFFDRVHKL